MPRWPILSLSVFIRPFFSLSLSRHLRTSTSDFWQKWAKLVLLVLHWLHLGPSCVCGRAKLDKTSFIWRYLCVCVDGWRMNFSASCYKLWHTNWNKSSRDTCYTVTLNHLTSRDEKYIFQWYQHIHRFSKAFSGKIVEVLFQHWIGNCEKNLVLVKDRGLNIKIIWFSG